MSSRAENRELEREQKSEGAQAERPVCNGRSSIATLFSLRTRCRLDAIKFFHLRKNTFFFVQTLSDDDVYFLEIES